MNSKLRTLVWITEKKSPQPERTAGDFFAMELFAVLGYLQTIVSNGLFTSQILPTKKPRKVQQNRWPLSDPISGHEITQERPLFYLFRPWTLFCSQNCFQWTFPKPREGQFLFCRYGWHFLGLFLVSEKTSFHCHKIVWLLCGLFRACYVTPKRPLSKRQKNKLPPYGFVNRKTTASFNAFFILPNLPRGFHGTVHWKSPRAALPHPLSPCPLQCRH